MADDTGTGWWGPASAGLGALGDIFTFAQNQKARSQQVNIYDILSNPAKLAAYINQLYQPLTAGANQAVQRDLGANWATMTGGATGGAMAQFIADALAKLESQRYSDTASQGIAALTRSLGGVPGQEPSQGLFGNILRNLQVLRQIRMPSGGTAPGIAPIPGGGGFAGGSESFREPGVFPSPVPATEGAF